MPTTTYSDSTFSASAIGARTDSSGSPASDIGAEEFRLANLILSEGVLLPSDGFKVSAQDTPGMSVKVGSGVARTDVYVVAGDAVGQGNYLVRLDVNSVNVSISAADSSQTRVDEVYLVVHDNAYDASARALPRIGYRRGDPGSGNPGPDAAWKAAALLARVTVGAGATSITSGNISDQRPAAGLVPRLTGTDIGTPRIMATTSDISVGNTTLVQAFQASLDPGRYLVECFLDYIADPAGHMKMGWTVPGGATGRWSSGGVFSGAGQRIGDLDCGMVAQNISLAVSGDSGYVSQNVEVGAQPVLHLLVPNAGTLRFSIAQQNSNGNPTVLRAGSSMRVTRIS